MNFSPQNCYTCRNFAKYTIAVTVSGVYPVTDDHSLDSNSCFAENGTFYLAYNYTNATDCVWNYNFLEPDRPGIFPNLGSVAIHVEFIGGNLLFTLIGDIGPYQATVAGDNERIFANIKDLPLIGDAHETYGSFCNCPESTVDSPAVTLTVIGRRCDEADTEDEE